MGKQSVTLFYENRARECGKVVGAVHDNKGLTWSPYSECGFSISVGGNLYDNLEALFSDGMDTYPNSVLISDKNSEQAVRNTVKKKGGLFAGLGGAEDSTFMRKINYGICKSDLYGALRQALYLGKGIGF